MTGKSTRDIKLKGFSAIVAIVAGSLLLIGTWSTLGQLLSSNPRSITEAPVNSSQNSTTGSNTAAPQISPLPEPTLAQDSPSNNPQSRLTNVANQGVLRVGNLSDHPVRVALLLKKSSSSSDKPNAQSGYEPPAHWDFAPGEGKMKGLLLSLPNRSIKVKRGDVLVAFAQDGSRRYWGPYVVGETDVPDWNANAREWELVLTP